MTSSAKDPFSDFFNSLSQFSQAKWPGLDTETLQNMSKTNMETMAEINQITTTAMQEIFARQQALASQMMADWQSSMTAMASGGNPMEKAQESAQKTTAAFTEMANIATEAQTRIAELVQKAMQGR